jgi:hypothetical protein
MEKFPNPPNAPLMSPVVGTLSTTGVVNVRSRTSPLIEAGEGSSLVAIYHSPYVVLEVKFL